MQSALTSIPDVTLIYFGITLSATIIYTIYVALQNLTASLLHILGWASTYALIWPAITCIIAILGMWYTFLPSSSSAFIIAAIISLIPAGGITSLALADVGSSPLARKADQTPPPPPQATVPPPPKPNPRWR